MSMADDDLQVPPEMLIDQKKMWFLQGYQSGIGITTDFIRLNQRQLRTTFFSIKHRFRNEKELSAQTERDAQDFYYLLQDFGNSVFSYAQRILFVYTETNELRDFCQEFLELHTEFLSLFINEPAKWLAVVGKCRKELPYDLFSSLIKLEKKGELVIQQKVLLSVVRDYFSYSAWLSSESWNEFIAGRDEFQCYCRICVKCCSVACGCRFEHYDDNECEQYDDDPNECDDSSHYTCYNCVSACACGNCQ